MKLLKATLILGALLWAPVAQAAIVGDIVGEVYIDTGSGLVRVTSQTEVNPGARILVKDGGSANVFYTETIDGVLKHCYIHLDEATKAVHTVFDRARCGVAPENGETAKVTNYNQTQTPPANTGGATPPAAGFAGGPTLLIGGVVVAGVVLGVVALDDKGNPVSAN